MASSISVQTSVTNNIDDIRNTISNNFNLTTTSSNVIVQSVVVNSTSYTPLSLGSLADVIMFTATNDDTVYSASTIQITGSTGVFIGSILTPGQQCVIPWSGSLAALSAKVVSGWPVGTATPANGVIQYSAQQS
jgi:hypothetical protein